MSHERAGKSDEWYTPKWIFDVLGCEFDLDVASSLAVRHVPAKLCIYERGLENPWFGYVWMNPPFGSRNGIVPWMEKFFKHGDGIALMPDRTSAGWFQDCAPRAELLLFLPKVKFERPDGSIGKWPSNGTCLMGVGSKAVQSLRRANEHHSVGFLVTPT